ncbi:MAG: DMT family transporter [Myxococcales bacterium]|nr:DMT family transporter [Myxococcales bacterium]USN50022.1 MAG: DMT family transporter [Myxococcales bacterium]
MNFFFFLSLCLGCIVVIQPTLNRIIGDSQGMAMAAFINGVVLLLSAAIMLIVLISFPDKFHHNFWLKTGNGFRLWHVLPGLMGLSLVLMVPLTMKNIGAFSTVLAMLAGQIITSFVIDITINQQAFSLARFTGLVLALLGAVLSFRHNS